MKQKCKICDVDYKYAAYYVEEAKAQGKRVYKQVDDFFGKEAYYVDVLDDSDAPSIKMEDYNIPKGITIYAFKD